MENSEILKLTEEEILKADEIIKKAELPELWQQFLLAPDDVKSIVRYFALQPKEKQDLLYQTIKKECAVA